MWGGIGDDVSRKQSDRLVGMDWLQARMEKIGADTLQEAAELCDLNRGNLYRYFKFETRPNIDVLPKLCKGLRSSPEEVLHALKIQV